MEKFRLLDHKDEIFHMAKKAPVVEIGEIWQTLPFKREVYRINKLEVLSDALIFLTTLPFEFENDFPIYIRLNYKNLVFKLSPEEYKTFNNQLSCIYPREAKADEDRGLGRTKLQKKSSLNMILGTIIDGSLVEIKVNLDDVSGSGLGVRTSIVNKKYFKVNGTFTMIKVCGQDYCEGGTLSVRHISVRDHQTAMKIGLSASVPFSETFFEILKESMKKEKYGAKFED